LIGIEEARRYYQGADAAHDFEHVLRVLRMAERIGTAEGADMAVVRAATLLHDIGRAGMGDADHAAAGACRARQILAGQVPQQVAAVVQAIAAHRFRAGPDPDTLEAQVLFDADKLDAIGAVGVARAFARAGASGQRLWAPMETVGREHWPSLGDDPQTYTPVHEYVVKLSRLTDRLYTPTGRMVAQERHAFMVAFFERFDAEARGDL
jgi:uncharacterized protein